MPPETKSEAPEPDESMPAPAPQRERVGPDYHIKDDKSHKGLILFVILILATAGIAAWYFKQHSSDQKSKTAQQLQTRQKAATDQIDSKTKTYTSPNFYLTFDYPADWTVSDTGGNSMSVISPPMELKNAVGQTVTGQIEMLIRNGTAKLSEFSGGNATAVFDSQKITYTKPTQTQRAQTYESFLQFASSNAGLDGIYITSDNGYTKGQAIPQVDISKGDPIISIIFDRCSNSSCSGNTIPLSIQESSWQNTNFSDPLQKMLESLSIT